MKEPPPEKRRDRRSRFDDRDDRRGGRGRDRDRFDDRDDRRGGRGRDRFDRSGKDMAIYRLAVGKRQHVRPGAIVGALANEGGLSNKDFGRITIAVDHTLVELPKDLPKSVFDNLRDTRISGQLIHMERDKGGASMDRGRGGRSNFRDRDDRRGGGRGGYRDRDGRGGRDRDRSWRD